MRQMILFYNTVGIDTRPEEAIEAFRKEQEKCESQLTEQPNNQSLRNLVEASRARIAALESGGMEKYQQLYGQEYERVQSDIYGRINVLNDNIKYYERRADEAPTPELAQMYQDIADGLKAQKEEREELLYKLEIEGLAAEVKEMLRQDGALEKEGAR